MERDIKDEDLNIKSPTIIAILIYAYAREYMCENFISKDVYKYGMDTDSLFFRSKDLYKINPKLFGDNPGQVKLELPTRVRGIYTGKKMYANYIVKNNVEEMIKFKFKGVSSSDKYITRDKVEYIKELLSS